MQKIACVHFQRNYIAIEIVCQRNNDFFYSSLKNVKSLNMFSEFFQKVKITKEDYHHSYRELSQMVNSFHHLELSCSKNLRHLQLSNLLLTKENISCLKKYSVNIERIDFLGYLR